MLATNEISTALGGRKILGKKIDSPLAFSDIINEGLPSASVFFLQNLLQLSDEEFSSTLGVSSKWLSRYRKTPKAHLTVDVSDKLYRVARIYKLAEEVLEGKESAINWLHRPQTGLNERVPLELIRTEAGNKEVEELLYRIEYGIYS